MYIDSHCHLNTPELVSKLPIILERMQANNVVHALVVSVSLSDWPSLIELVLKHKHLSASVGVHPTYEKENDPTVQELVSLTNHNKVVAIGETGLDYYSSKGPFGWQRNRFRKHIQAAREAGVPLIIHTRSATQDTLNILREEKAFEIGGVFHCFTESWEVAKDVLDMNFFISLSGIVTFKTARTVHEVARKIPLDKLLIETDAPYLAPVPYRGKLNDPSKVVHIAQRIAYLKEVPLLKVARLTTQNFFRLFKKNYQSAVELQLV